VSHRSGSDGLSMTTRLKGGRHARGARTARSSHRLDTADTGAANSGAAAATPSATAKARARRQADALAELSVAEAEKRLVLDWTIPLRHATFYKAIYRPAVLRANRLAGKTVLPPSQSFHSLRHTYASLCVAAGIKLIDIAELMGHRDVKTTLTVYAHLINTDDHAGNMTALGALATPTPKARQRHTPTGLKLLQATFM
jgi:Phage integrase family